MTAATTTMGAEDAKSPVQKSGKKKLILLAAPVLLVGAGAGLWFSGLASSLPGMKHEAPKAMAEAAPPAPTYVEMPQIVANLNAGARRTSFVKLQARLELSKPEDVAAFTAAQPRVLDLFQTYLREMRPEELRGSMGTFRLREQLIARASLAIAPARVVDVLFTELLVQ
jgi:flagellar FliL protein